MDATGEGLLAEFTFTGVDDDGGSIRQAISLARGSEESGAEGVLLLPPYLTDCDQEGLFEYASAVIRATKLPVIVYNRSNAIYSAATVAALSDRHEDFIGFKDGIGDIEHLSRVYAACGDRLLYIGGLPTAEAYALPLLQLGLSTYSSAMFNFVPGFALEFYAAVRRQDRTAVTEKLQRFVFPYLDIRNRGRGFGVSIVKAGVKAVGRRVGPVRPPLHDLSHADFDDLCELIDRAGVRPTPSNSGSTSARSS